MAIYQQYLNKMAADEVAYTPAAILRYPFLGNKPKDVDEMADRREALGLRVGLGATAGMLGALALRGLARKGVLYAKGQHPAGIAATARRITERKGADAAAAFLDLANNGELRGQVLSQHVHALAPVVGALTGAVGGAALHSGLHALDNVQQHHQAVQDYNAHGGKPLPFLVRHPYLTALGAPIVGGALGAVAGAGVAKSLGKGMGEGMALGTTISSSLAQPIINKLTRAQRDEVLPTAKLRADQGDDMQSYLG